MSAAGLGLRLHDRIYETEHLRAFDQWWEHAHKDYLQLDQQQPKRETMYYDPLIDYHHGQPPGSSLGVAFYLMPHRPEAARTLWERTKQALGWAGAEPQITQRQPRTNILGRLVAQELGEDRLAERFRELAEEDHEPVWDAQRAEQTWGFKLGEEYPRGQYNALQALAEVLTEGAWSRLYDEPNLRKLQEPTIEGIDFPDLLLSRASWDREEQRLVATSVARNRQVTGRDTRFRVTGLDPETPWQVTKDGQPLESARFSDGVLEVRDGIGSHEYTIERA